MIEKLPKIKNLVRSATVARISNLLLNSVERRLNISRPRSYPLSLDVVLTRACNLKCTFCISSTVEGERWLSYKLYQRVAHELFPYAREVLFCSGGEPLLYPKVREALQLADRHRLLTVMVSNGMLLDKEKCEWIVADQSLKQYFVSFDGATKESLEGIRRGAKFDKIIDNVARLSRHKNDAGAKFPEIGLRYSVMRQNAEELPGICGLCKSMGVTRVEVSYVVFANEMAAEDSLFFHQDLAEDVFKETAAKAAEHGISVSLPPLPRDDPGQHKCEAPWRFAQIDTDGSIRFCYKAWIQTVGNFSDGFKDVWQGDDFCRLRKTLHTDSPHFPYCAFCSARNGTNNEAAHNQTLHQGAYRFPNGSTKIDFNQRSEENRLSYQSQHHVNQKTQTR